MFCGVVQRCSQFFHRCVQAVIEFDESALGPKLAPNILASYYPSLRLQQDKQQLKGLVLQGDTETLFSQLSRARVSLKNPETING
jgi:hypothetical protein